MVEYKWFRENVPSNLEVKQVYGIVFDEYGRVFLRIEDEKYKLTGGKPKDKYESYEDTLKREFLEEVNITLKDIYMLGYQYVDEKNGLLPYVQVRMIARIDKVFDKRPDLDNGKIYKRFLVNKSKASKYLNYGSVGDKMIEDAIYLANKKYKFKKTLKYEEFI